MFFPNCRKSVGNIRNMWKIWRKALRLIRIPSSPPLYGFCDLEKFWTLPRPPCIGSRTLENFKLSSRLLVDLRKLRALLLLERERLQAFHRAKRWARWRYETWSLFFALAHFMIKYEGKTSNFYHYLDTFHKFFIFSTYFLRFFLSPIDGGRGMPRFTDFRFTSPQPSPDFQGKGT